MKDWLLHASCLLHVLVQGRGSCPPPAQSSTLSLVSHIRVLDTLDVGGSSENLYAADFELLCHTQCHAAYAQPGPPTASGSVFVALQHDEHAHSCTMALQAGKKALGGAALKFQAEATANLRKGGVDVTDDSPKYVDRDIKVRLGAAPRRCRRAGHALQAWRFGPLQTGWRAALLGLQSGGLSGALQNSPCPLKAAISCCSPAVAWSSHSAC